MIPVGLELTETINARNEDPNKNLLLHHHVDLRNRIADVKFGFS